MSFRKLVKSFYFAFSGIFQAFTEQNMRIHGIAAVTVVICGYFTGLSKIEWLILLLIIALVMAAEMFNTAIENVVDLASPDFHPLAKKAKDVAAGAVLILAIASVVIGLIIFLPKWM